VNEYTPKPAYIGLVKNFDGKTWRVSLRDERGYIIKDDTGQYEMTDHSRTNAVKEAKRLAKVYGVEVREGAKA